MDKFAIVRTTPSDLEFVYKLFDSSIAYQEERGYHSWRNYDQSALVRDVENGHQYKIIIDRQIAIAFSVCYTDPVIWRQYERGDAIYLHRIVVNPAFKGRRLFGLILEWAVTDARSRGLKYIRMDTWADNPFISDYYKSFGFKFVEDYVTPDSPELPAHNRNIGLTLLEYKLD